MKRPLFINMSSYLIGISGGSASGKTSFVRSLKNLFNGDELSFISQDNYYKSAVNHPRDSNGAINFDLPECIDLTAFIGDLRKLKLGSAIQRKEYLFQLEDIEPRDIHVSPAPIIVVEGLFILHEVKISQELDLKLFIEADEQIKLDRRVLRDTQERGVTRELVEYQWEHHVKPAYQKYLEPYKHESDLIINNNKHFESSLDVISNHINRILHR